jgi:prevent-host-death family protein
MKRSINKKEITANIATLKARFSEFLRIVKNGKEVTVLDHKLPIAKIIPFEAGSTLKSILPQKSFSELAKITINPLKIKPKFDSLSLLLEERGSR